MIDLINRFNQRLLRVEKIVAAVLIAGIAVCVFLQVLFRYVFESPLAWTDELSRYLQVWMVFIGAAIAADRLSHFHLDLLHQYLPRGALHYVDIGVLLATLAFTGVLGFYGMQILETVHRQLSPAIGVQMSYAYSAIPVGCALMFWHLTVHLLNTVSDLVSNTAAQGEQQ